MARAMCYGLRYAKRMKNLDSLNYRSKMRKYSMWIFTRFPLVEATCWWYAEGASTCIAMVEGVDLVGRPINELAIVNEAPCAPEGPWSYSFSTTFWCRGAFDLVGVSLRPI